MNCTNPFIPHNETAVRKAQDCLIRKYLRRNCRVSSNKNKFSLSLNIIIILSLFGLHNSNGGGGMTWI